MRAHTWEIKTDYAPNIGAYDFEQCSVCGASAPSVFQSTPFYADGSGLKVSDNCDEAKEQIAVHVATWIPWSKRPPKRTPEAKVGAPTHEITPDQIRGFEQKAQEMADIGYQLWGYKYEHLDPEQMESFREYCDAEHEKIEAQWVRERAEWQRTHEGAKYNGG